MMSYFEARSRLPASDVTQALLLLLLLGSFVFGVELLRLLASRVAHVPLPSVSLSFLCLVSFWLALRVEAFHLLPLPTALAGIVHVQFFVSVTRAVAEALGIHPLRIRHAASTRKVD